MAEAGLQVKGPNKHKQGDRMEHAAQTISGGGNHFTLLRTVAALLVLWSHQHALQGLPEAGVLGIHSWAGLGVVIFFSISGYLVTQSWLSDPHVGRFAMRRLLRIWPAFAVVIVLSALVMGPIVSELRLRDYLRDPRLAEYLKNLVFQLRSELPLRFEGNALPLAINGSLWTIPLELRCYAVLAALGMIGMLMRRRAMLLLAALLALAYGGIQLRGEYFVAAASLRIEDQYFIEFGIAFLIGCAIKLYWLEIQKRLLGLCAAAMALAALAWAMGRPVLAMFLVVPLFALAFATRSWPGLRLMDRLGDFSYGIYLYAFPVQQVLIWKFRDRLAWWPLLGMTVLLTVGLAALSWFGVERPLQRLKPKRRQIKVAGEEPVPAIPSLLNP